MILKMGEHLKFQLVSEICSISNIACSHTELGFIDWYHLLKVEEDAEVDVIRKQYRRFALQVHPDKNKHPKAEFAFKLLSQAYLCLSDNAKREVFNAKRWKNVCNECNNPSNNNPRYNKSKSRCNSRMKRLKEMRDRLREEAMVMDKCIKANNTSALPKESPVFNPSDSVFQSKYNQQRRAHHTKETPVFNPSNHQFWGKLDVFWYNKIRRRGNDSPIFETGMFRSKSACVRQ